MNTKTYKTTVIATVQFEAVHNWPECPIPEVSYLRDLHRHVFWVTVEKEVHHDDRDVEIICLKRDTLAALKQFSDRKCEEDSTPQKYCGAYLGRTSCETLARYLCDALDLVAATVLEDNENGAKVVCG